MKKILKGYRVIELSNMRAVSKVFPTWLGAKRVRNRIVRENRNSVGCCYTIAEVWEYVNK